MGGRPQAPSTWERPYQIRWRDLDASGHVANSAYLDLCSDARFAFLSEAGFGPLRFAEHEVGPLVFRDEVTYFRELRLLDVVSVTLEIAGAAPDGSRWRLNQQIVREDEVATTLSSEGSWLNLRSRELTIPPADLAAALRTIPRTSDFIELPAI